MPAITVNYLGRAYVERVLVPEYMPFSDFLIHYLLAARTRMTLDGKSIIDNFYRFEDLESALSTGNFEEKYQDRRRRLLENPRETVSLWGGGYETDAVEVNEPGDVARLKAERQTPQLLTGDEIDGMFDLSYTALKTKIAQAAKPTLEEFILETCGYNMRGYFVTVGETEIGYLADALRVDTSVLQMTNGQSIYLLPDFGTSDNPFINDLVIRDVTTEAQSAAAELFRQYLEQRKEASDYSILII